MKSYIIWAQECGSTLKVYLCVCMGQNSINVFGHMGLEKL